MENLNPFDRFKHIYTPPRIMVYSLIEVNGTQEFAFCIKEEMQYINRYKHMTIEVRLGILKINNVLIVPMMLMVNNDTNMMYETMFNYRQTSGGQQFLDALKKQDDIKLIFFNEKHEAVRKIGIKNSIKADIELLEKHLKESNSWSMDDFDRVKEELYKLYPSGTDLWKALDRVDLQSNN
jgi:hypothetical protein